MIELYLHDGDVEATKHGPRGPTHCATITVDYEYQAEQWVSDIEELDDRILRIEVPSLRREWRRNPTTRKMVEVTLS